MFGHELDVPVARALPIWISRARNRRRPGWDDDVGRSPGLAGSGDPVDAIAVVGSIREKDGDGALRLAQQVRHLGGIIGMTVGQHVCSNLTGGGVHTGPA